MRFLKNGKTVKVKVEYVNALGMPVVVTKRVKADSLHNSDSKRH